MMPSHTVQQNKAIPHNRAGERDNLHWTGAVAGVVDGTGVVVAEVCVQWMVWLFVMFNPDDVPFSWSTEQSITVLRDVLFAYSGMHDVRKRRSRSAFFAQKHHPGIAIPAGLLPA